MTWKQKCEEILGYFTLSDRISLNGTYFVSVGYSEIEQVREMQKNGCSNQEIFEAIRNPEESQNMKTTEFTYEPIDFRIPVREGFYNYRQKVEPAYLVTDLGIDWASIVVHRKPGKPDDRWFVSEFASGGSITIPNSTDRDTAVQHAIDTLKKLGREGYQKALEK